MVQGVVADAHREKEPERTTCVEVDGVCDLPLQGPALAVFLEAMKEISAKIADRRRQAERERRGDERAERQHGERGPRPDHAPELGEQLGARLLRARDPVRIQRERREASPHPRTGARDRER